MGSKQIVKDNSLPDRISNLPSNIIDCILDRTPVRDAVATSILSKEWRYKWRTIGNLVFDEDFVGDVIKPWAVDDYEMIKLEYSNIISNILLPHLGPIRQFVLYIPDFGYKGLPFHLNSSWMLFISQNEVKELAIEGPDAAYSLPSSFFKCSELRHLKLHGFSLDLHIPQDFGEFSNLLSLDLCVFQFQVDEDAVSNMISKCPLLERLSLIVDDIMGTVVISAPRLRFLNSDLNLIKLKNAHSVTDMSLQFGEWYSCDLINIFGSVPKVETTTLYSPGIFRGYVPRVWSVTSYPPRRMSDLPPDVPMSLPTTLHNHKSFTIRRTDISSPKCFYFVFCILKCSPNLQKLNLGMYPSPTSEEEDEAALHFIDMQTREPPLTMNNLLTVKIDGLLRSKIGMLFVKLILSRSPNLKTMYLAGEDTRCSHLEKDILHELDRVHINVRAIAVHTIIIPDTGDLLQVY